MPALAGVQAMITAIIAEHHQVPVEKIGPSYARHRARILRNIQKISDDCWTLRDLPFRYFQDDAFDISALDNELDSPGFANEGRNGSVFIPSVQQPVYWRPLHVVNRLTQLHPAETGAPRYFTIWASEGTRNMRVFPTPDTAYVASIFFLMEPPELEDDDDGGLAFWPTRWSERLIMPGAVMLEMKDKGDVSAMIPQKAEYEAAKFAFVREEQPGTSEAEYAPRYAGSASVWDGGDY